ncbi:superoxide dismutase family protein [Thermoactinomyces sp. CICC 23799]|jgi:superoxide dismutase, Cu-Zn family|uniref:superoxide dismutase family protein n=1 Tax=Thermoactinomyces sp. CICC 23799 TaxID=2767429 RepID=UPI0018DC3317|nr:superoxide dismutase family protein [Thermoactinomyces sp. CICC 23799]MBH8601449.1 superoxide dismutase family protein [Thermoactinomyces sp. CICC 23799]
MYLAHSPVGGYLANQPNYQAYAWIQGGPLAPELRGYVTFTEVPGGTEVFIEVNGLPPYQPGGNGRQPVGPFGFHLHENGSCAVGNPDNPFQAAGNHWNPDNQPHGNHPGDFPVLFSNNGYARMSFFTNRFRPSQVIGKSVMIHQNPDDFRSQPSGNSGKRLACGVIQGVYGSTSVFR